MSEKDPDDLPIWASHYDDIERLRRAWETKFENRAYGGAISLSGFHYQLLVTLHDTLEAWWKRPGHEQSRPTVLAECLSDILDNSTNDIVLVTQVKRTTRADSFHDALTELWLIYELALETTPSLIPHLRFRILSSKTELKDFERALSNWHPVQHPAGPELEVFRQRVTVQLFSNPEDEVLAFLAKRLRATDPTGYVQRWMGKLLSAASKKRLSGFEDAAEFIWNDLQSIKNSSLATPPGIYIWTSQDTIPEDIVEGKVLTGERPQTHHLSEGFFAPRPAVYHPLVDQVREWSIESTSDPDKQLRLPVFWIGGRSGSGKSVALMHVLALLYESGLGTVLWLGNKTELLRQAIPWALQLNAQGRQVIIGIDDPYAPNTQSTDIVWKESLAILEGVRQSGDWSALPLIVCCGPSEQAERIQRDLPEEVNVRFVEMPEEGQEDISQLRNWYTQRTKKLPPNIGDENVLLVQLFFQWETGQDLKQFASRFRNRIKESDSQGALEELITHILCVNRLYVGYPAGAIGQHLTPELQDTFRRLREEHHIKQTVSDYGIGLWLAHPHLSNVIYQSWYPLKSNRAQRTEHLRRVITECLEFGNSPSEKMAPLWAISNAMLGTSSQSPLVGRLDQETITNLLPYVYASRLQVSGKRLTLSELPVWIQLHALSSLKVLRPDPVDEALSCITVDNLAEQGLRLTCHKLLQYHKSFPEHQRLKITESIIELLVQAPQWHEWGQVADDAYRRTKDSRFVMLIIDWLKVHPQSKWAGRLFDGLFTHNPTDPEILDAAGKLLPQVEGEWGWGDIAIRLMEVSKPELPVPVLEWAKNNCRELGACFVLGHLLRSGRRLARGWAFKWCARWHRERIANYVLEPLLTSLGQHEKLRDWCIRWVSAGHWNVDTGYIVEKMINTFPTDTEVLSIGLRWLENNNLGHGSWQYIWRALYKADPYMSLAITGRQTNLTHPVLQPARKHPGPDEPELDASQKLVELMPDDPKAWYYLAIGLGKSRQYDEEIDALLRATRLDPQFAEAWQALGATYSRVGQDAPALQATLKLTELRPDDPEAWYYLSIAHGRGGQYKEQVAALIKATELDSQFAKSWWALRNTYEQLGWHELALEAELKLLGLEPATPESWYDLAITCSRDKRYEDQVAALIKATELNPDFADAWQALGSGYNRLGQNESALKAALRLTRLKPDDAQAWYYLSIAHNKVGQYAEQVAALIKATDLNSQYAKAWQALGAAYSELKQFAPALVATTRLVELRPDDAQAWYYLAIAYSKVSNDEEQLAALIKAIELDPQFTEAWQKLGATCSRLERTDLALAANLKLTELSPDAPEAWLALGATYNQLGQFELAVAAGKRLTELSPNDPEAWYYLSVAQGKTNQSDEQITALLKATQLDPQFVKAWQALGAVYSRLGRTELALSANLKMTELNPDNPKAWYYLAIAHGKAGHNEDKAAALLKAVTMDPQSAEAWQMMGAVYNELGQNELALEAVLKLMELRPDDAQIWYHLAIAYSKLGRDEEQLAVLIRATELDPQYVEAWQRLGAVYTRRRQYDLSLKARTKVVELKPDDAIAQEKLSRARAVVEAFEYSYLEPEDLKTEESKKFYSLAKSYVASGQFYEAIDAFKEAIKTSTDEKKASAALQQSLINTATTEFYSECYERAIMLLKIILIIDPNIADAWRLLSSSYRRVGKKEEALEAAKRLSKLLPSDSDARYKLGKRYASLGQFQNAVEAFKQALQLNENHKAAHRDLNKLRDKNY